MTSKQICLICGKDFDAKQSGHGPRKYCSLHCSGLAVGGKNFKDLTGKRFGKLTVISLYDQLPSTMYRWLCKCDCGNTTIVQSGHLNIKGVKSCYPCTSLIAARANTTHGLSKTKFYKYWRKRMRRDADRTWTLEMDLAIRELQPTCVICNSSISLQIDHVVPFQKGGSLEPGNAVMLCHYHNGAKNDRDLSELPQDWQDKIKRAAKQFLDAWNNR